MGRQTASSSELDKEALQLRLQEMESEHKKLKETANENYAKAKELEEEKAAKLEELRARTMLCHLVWLVCLI